MNILDGETEYQEQWVKFCRIMYRTLLQVKFELAEKHQTTEKEFDSTVAFAIVGKKRIGCFQVGDGSIVVRRNDVCQTVFVPEKGEYANQTHFLRPGGEESLKFQYALLDSEQISGIAITSDGPEHLMFRLSDMTPGKIFDMFFEDLEKQELQQQDLMDYLTRREWADDPRGVDDRSVALLAKIHGESDVLPKSEEKTSSVPEEESKHEVITEAETVKSEVAIGANHEPNSEIQNRTVEDKKKLVLYRSLIVAGRIAIVGLMVAGIFLVKQWQKITQQKQEILHLNQQIIQLESHFEKAGKKQESPKFLTPDNEEIFRRKETWNEM